MDIQVLYKPAYALGVIQLVGNEQVRVEAGSMVSMSQGVTLKTKATGGLIKAHSIITTKMTPNQIGSRPKGASAG